MSLVTLTFALFCICVLFIYFIVPRKFQWVVLLISSLFFLFYDNFNVFTILQALIIIISSYVCGILIQKNDNNKKKKFYLMIGIIVILGLLLYLKYTNLFLVSINSLFGTKFKMVYRNSLIGISYYSLIMISYLIDIYRGGVVAQKNIFKFALFMCYFPILTSGPFIKYDSIKDDLYSGHKFDYTKMCYGLLRILFGLFKILVISERVGYFVDIVYGNFSNFSGLYICVAALLYTIQLYTNFSGSIDIIMGVSEIIGINLPENFNTPFFSRTITEFWRRWHITLGSWLKDYVFYPLLKSNFMQKLNVFFKKKFGKKVGKRVPLYLTMLIMWILIGAWHNGAYHFIIGSGILQFVYIFLEDNLEPAAIFITNKLRISRDSLGYKMYQIIRTYILFSISMIFFRATSVSNAVDIIEGIFINHKTSAIVFQNNIVGKMELIALVLSIIVFFVLEKISSKHNIREAILKKNIFIRWTIIYIILFSIIIFGCYGSGYNPTTFIYRGV